MTLDHYQYFIYALDINKSRIASAWHCPDEESSQRVFAIVDQRMEEELGEVWYGFDFDFGIAVTEEGEDSHNELEYIAPPRHKNERWLKRFACKHNDFVLATIKTEQFLRTKKKRPPYMQFMYFVKLALEGKPLPTITEQKNSPKPEKTRKQRYKKYEFIVGAYIDQLKKSVLEGDISSAEIANLSYKEIAKAIAKTDGYSEMQIESIEYGVRHTEAWNNRKETFQKVFDTLALRERRTKNMPYQDVQ